MNRPTYEPVADAALDEGAYESVVRRYEWRLRQLMEEAKDAFLDSLSLSAAGAAIEGPERMDDGEQASFCLKAKIQGAEVHASLIVYDGAVHEGAADKVAFGVDVVGDDGEVIASVTPWNYQPEFWVDARDDAAVKARLRALEEVWSPRLAADLIAKRFKKGSGS